MYSNFQIVRCSWVHYFCLKFYQQYTENFNPSVTIMCVGKKLDGWASTGTYEHVVHWEKTCWTKAVVKAWLCKEFCFPGIPKMKKEVYLGQEQTYHSVVVVAFCLQGYILLWMFCWSSGMNLNQRKSWMSNCSWLLCDPHHKGLSVFLQFVLFWCLLFLQQYSWLPWFHVWNTFIWKEWEQHAFFASFSTY